MPAEDHAGGFDRFERGEHEVRVEADRRRERGCRDWTSVLDAAAGDFDVCVGP